MLLHDFHVLPTLRLGPGATFRAWTFGPSVRAALVIVTFILLGPSTALAQSGPGARAGLNVSTAVGNPALAREALLGYTVGVHWRHAVTTNFAIQPEAVLSQKGVRWMENDEAGAHRGTYVDVPIVLVFATQFISTAAIDLYGGPMAGFRVSESPLHVPGVDHGPALNAGVVIGADVSSRLRGRTERFGVGIRQTIGFTGAVPAQSESLRLSAFSVTALFRL
jgi:hypothetical protein